MNENDFQMIIDFADGTLDPAMEDALFLKLNADEELRQEFKAHMAIKNAARTGSSAVFLPAASKAAVFSKLGLSIPSSGYVSSASGIGASLLLLLRNKKVIATAGVALLLTAIFLLFDNPKTDDVNLASKNPVKSENQQTADISKYPTVSSVEGTQTDSRKTTSVKVRVNPDRIESISSVKPNDISVTSGTLASQEVFTQLVTSEIVNQQNRIVTKGQSFNAVNINGAYSPIPVILEKDQSGIDVEFSGSNYVSTVSPTIEPAKYSPFNRMGLSGMYRLSDVFGLGANLRQETFFLRYRGTEGNEEFIYEQQPNFTTFSLVSRYDMAQWGSFKPFVQLSAGINSIGFVGRGQTGLQYTILPNLSAVLGVEYGYMLYTHQNNYFNSSKFGLNYGLMFSF
jgi:hypothetical protein